MGCFVFWGLWLYIYGKIITMFTLLIVGEGFLRYMIRYIAGALFALGRNEIYLSDISEALATHKEEKLSAKAKSCGLHLREVRYA